MIRIHGITPARRKPGNQPLEGDEFNLSKLQFPVKYNPDLTEQDKQYWKSIGFKFDFREPKAEVTEDNCNDTKTQGEKKKPSCFMCGRQFLYKSSLVKHLHTHMGKTYTTNYF